MKLSALLQQFQWDLEPIYRRLFGRAARLPACGYQRWKTACAGPGGAHRFCANQPTAFARSVRESLAGVSRHRLARSGSHGDRSGSYIDMANVSGKSYGLTILSPIIEDSRRAHPSRLRCDLRGLGFAAAVSLASVLLFGLVPALQAIKPDLTPALKAGSVETGKRSRLLGRNALVIGQVAASLLLILASQAYRGAAIVLASLAGFRTDHLLTATSTVRWRAPRRHRQASFIQRHAIAAFRRH